MNIPLIVRHFQFRQQLDLEARRSVAVLFSPPSSVSLLAGSIIFFVAEKQANHELRLRLAFVVCFN